MRHRFYSVMIALGLAVGLAASSSVALAQEQTREITISRDFKLGTQAVEKGNYKLRFTEGKDGEVVFLKGKREVLKAGYKWTPLKGSAPDTTVVYTLASDGSYQIKRVEFKGMDKGLVLE